MKFQKSVNVWADGVTTAITEGTLKLQRGQWVRCGENARHPARFVGVTAGGSIWIAHWQGNSAATVKRFKTMCDAMQTRERHA